MVEQGGRGLQLTEKIGRPLYQRVADDLRAKIASEEVPTGQAIPSTSKLSEHYSVSNGVVRKAVDLLTVEGLLAGHPGKAVYVTAKPEDVDAERTSIEGLTRQVSELRLEVRELAERVGAGHPERDLANEVAGLRGLVEQLYNRLGHPLPNEDADDNRAGSADTGT